jgi:RNA polymerase sigma-70 factor (ECF subfamily)
MESVTVENDGTFLAALRRGDENAFLSLVNQYGGSMLRVCQVYVNDHAMAEEVVQDTWIDMLQGLKRFERRSSLKTWLFTILTNNAKTRGKRESRSIPFSAMEDLDLGGDEPAVDPERFLPAGHEWAGHWVDKPQPWARTSEDAVQSKELLVYIHSAIQLLPPNQRTVVTLRDVEGWNSEEVCNVLGISETNQRVLLHRARSKLRLTLEQFYDEKIG